MRILRTRMKKACALPREYGPLTWYGLPLDASGMPIRYNWSVISIRTYLNESLRAVRGHQPGSYFRSDQDTGTTLASSNRTFQS